MYKKSTYIKEPIHTTKGPTETIFPNKAMNLVIIITVSIPLLNSKF